MVQQPLRGSTPDVRETTGSSIHASSTAWSWPRALRRAVLLSVLFGGFFAVVGARTALNAGRLASFVEFFVMSFVAIVLSMVCERLLIRWRAVAHRVWVRAGITALFMTLPMGLFVWTIDLTLARPAPRLKELPGYILISFAVSVFMSLLAVAMMRERLVFVPQGGPSVRFLERLPAKLRGGQVWAVEAEDHYLRLHTSKGQDLILMRLADAVAELDGIEGMQVHRSWWVARDAVANIARGDGRAELTLQDGSKVPVSRTYARVLREKGWL
ncbi:MAG TPA: LytTR family DNA-binding domain-containing protein [Caulobacteraceae bacterium]|nr:LytTR family DNA-binding domain-containing protein [Caulobacteraceae bacterium]